jgi:uncharacterized protein (TIGR02680 family)
MSSTTLAPPVPRSEAALERRWRPTRAGLVNVWRYLEESFEFHGGRLLLRGPNGSGKSMALELLFPFLLDASALPTRLSSSARSRGGLYDRIMGGSDKDVRIGFLWAEFTRGEDAFTIGARVRASKSTARATTDWFTTSQRVGHELFLLDEARMPLSKKHLEDALGARGAIYSGPEDYRAAVAARLFPGYGDKQYDAVITALLALRKEKLSQDLLSSPARLSDILSASLPPVDEHDIAEIAEGFEKLDRRRDEIAALEGDRDLVRRLAARRQAYARAVVASEANAVRAAETRRDDVTKRARRAREDLDEATAAASRIADELAAATGRIDAIGAETDTLKNLDAYRQGAALAPMRDELKRLEDQKQDALRQLEQRTERERAAGADVERCAVRAAEAEGNEATARREVDELSGLLGAGAVVEGAAAESDPAAAGTLLEAWSESRRSQLDAMRARARAHAEAVNERSFREEQLERDRASHDRAIEERAARDGALHDATDSYARAVGEWVGGLHILGSHEVRTSLPSPPADPAVVAGVAERRASEVRARAAVRRAELDRRLGDVAAERAVLDAERAELVAGRTLVPDAPAWRSGRAATALPLWQLIDFGPDCPDELQGPIEAALLAAGLLDALVTSEGRTVLPDHAADLVTVPGAPAPGRTLADVLVPEAGAPEALVSLLKSIGIGAPEDGAPVSVAADGSFRLAVLVGRGPVEEPRFIGAAARDRERTRRIAEIDDELSAVARDDAALRSGLDDVARGLAALQAELDALPDSAPLDAARRAVERARTVADETDARVRSSEEALRTAEGRVSHEQRELALLAARHHLPTGEDELAEVGSLLRRFDARARAWAARRSELGHAVRAHADAAGRLEERTEDVAHARAALETAERQAREVRARLAALESSVGAAYQQIAAQLDALAVERRALDKRRGRLENERVDLAHRAGTLEEQLDAAERDRARADDERTEAQRSFLAAITDGIADDAGAELDVAALDGTSAVLTAARAIAQSFPDEAADPQSLQRLHMRVVEALHAGRAALAARADVNHEESAGGWWLLRVSVGGLRRSVSDYARALERELQAARAELKDDEHNLFDRTLTGSVREAVAERIRRSNELVDRINDELARVRTQAAALRVRLRWEVDAEQPDAVRSARRLLLKDPADLTDSERAALHDFFRARIDQVRLELEAATGWEERLRAVLDYRAWHRFTLEIGHRDWDGYRPATSARLQRLSTGERSLALHLPMLASVAAHYDGGSGEGSGCPRLILLDELFAGVDVANRAQLFELLVTWDLDAVLTSEHEWCAYSTLDAIAIHHLHAEGDEPVTSSRFTWNGRARVAAPAHQ